MTESATVSIRIPADLLDHIDQSAAQAGENRTSYIVSWLPDAYALGDGHTQTQADKHQRSDR